MRRAAFALAFAVMALAALAAPAWAQAVAGTPLPTRGVQTITQLETALLTAMQARDAAKAESLLGPDFEMVIAQDPAEPVIREDWLAAVAQRGAGGSYRVTGMTTRESGTGWVASFVLQPIKRGAVPVFIVDLWQPVGSDGALKLIVRHAALATGSRRAIPGDAKQVELPKKY